MSPSAVPKTRGGSPGRNRSLVKSLFAGEVDEELVFPYPRSEAGERARIESLIVRFEELAEESIDPRQIEDQRWIGNDLVQDLGAAGLLGLQVAQEYGGAGLTQTGYYRVFEAIARTDPSLAIVLGIHQSIGTRGYVLFGNEEQKDRFLPDLASGRKLGGFALTEMNAGSDAFNIQSRAVRQRDGSWRLNGEKRYVGNAARGSLFVTIARAEGCGNDGHVALIVEAGMEGFEVGARYEMLGVKANDVRPLRFNDVRIPADNVLGEPGDGFRIAMRILNNGRLGLGAVSVGAAKRLAELATTHVQGRRQFGRALGDFELVQDKIAWMTRGIYGLEAMCYMTSGLVDDGLGECALESALTKVTGSEFVFELANVALQLRGGEGYMEPEPYEKILRDVRVFPVFEGANDVLRAFVGIQGLRAVLARSRQAALDGDGRGGHSPPPHRDGQTVLYNVHPSLEGLGRGLIEQARLLRAGTEQLAGADPVAQLERQLDQRRLANAAAGLYAQVAVVSRTSQVLEERGQCDPQVLLAEEFCAREQARLERELDDLASPTDARVAMIARLAYESGPSGYAFPPSADHPAAGRESAAPVAAQ